MAKPEKVTLQEAIRLIPDGSTITFGGFTIWRRPMAAVYEMVRQGKQDLHLVEVNGGTHTEVLIGAGCVKIWESCWVGHELYGKLGACLDRFARSGKVIVEDYSHVHMLYRMLAGSMGLPYLPTYASLGTDILNPEYDNLGRFGLRNGSHPKIPKKKYEIVRDIFSGNELIHVPAVNPDWCIVLAQMVGEEGTVRVKGQKYSDVEAIRASEKVIVIAEQIVPEEYLRRDPDLNLVPPYLVDYLVELPWAGHPTGCQGMYEVDGQFIKNFYEKSKTQEMFDSWAQEWIFGVGDHYGYLEKIGVRQLEDLRANQVLGYSTRMRRGSR
ncbi:MAG: acyl CoA--acetate/3-ketoacid CoA transferase subunit alpha [Armatimonadetes bacterium]|nr:acyl CoA--acetate/3-ketoacid CoA transferase subunit alpha [Armatimonadota bacterium]